MESRIRSLLAEMKVGLGDLYGERLRRLYLFGSHARGEADDESDVDVLIVLDRVEDYSHDIRRTSQLVSELSLRYGRSISCVYASEGKWAKDQTMFFINVREEALPA